MSNIKSVKIDTKKTKSRKKIYQDILNSPSKIQEILTKKRKKFHSHQIPDLPPIVHNKFYYIEPTSSENNQIEDIYPKKESTIEKPDNILDKIKDEIMHDKNPNPILQCEKQITKKELNENRTPILSSNQKIKNNIKSRNLKKKKSNRRVKNLEENRTKKRRPLKSKQRTRKNLSSQVIDKMFKQIILEQEVELKNFKENQRNNKLNEKQKLILKTLKFIIGKNEQKLLDEYIIKMNRSHVEMILTKLSICFNKKTPLPLLKSILNNTLSSNIRIIKNQ